MKSQAFRNWQQVGSCNFNSSSGAHRDHNMSLSPNRKKSTPSAANAKFFEHLKSKPSLGLDIVQVKTPLNRQAIDTFNNTMIQFNKRSSRPVSSTLHSTAGKKTTRSGSTFGTGVMSLITHENKYMPQAHTLKLRAKSGAGRNNASKRGFVTSFNKTPLSLN